MGWIARMRCFLEECAHLLVAHGLRPSLPFGGGDVGQRDGVWPAPRSARTLAAGMTAHLHDGSAHVCPMNNSVNLGSAWAPRNMGTGFDENFDYVWNALRRLGVRESDLEDLARTAYSHLRLGRAELSAAATRLHKARGAP
jgi:hypothetical protein